MVQLSWQPIDLSGGRLRPARRDGSRFVQFRRLGLLGEVIA